MTSNTTADINALCQFAAEACQAQLALAVEIDEQGRALTAGASSHHKLGAFNLGNSGLLGRKWDANPVPATDFRLPSAILHALEQPATAALYVPTPAEHSPPGGLLLLWVQNPPALPLIGQLPLLAETVASLLSARRQNTQQIAMEDQFRDLFESVPSGIVLIDGHGLGAMINERAGTLLGCFPGAHQTKVLANLMRDLRESCDNREELAQAYATQIGNVDFSATMNWSLGERTLEVTTHPVRGEGEQGRIWLFTDVTAELMMAAELRRLATSDPLTGAANRRHFEERSGEILALQATKQGRGVSLLMLDVDHFKRINDNYGHPAGDEVLKIVAQRCRDTLRAGDLFARFGGEEFIALLDPSAKDELPAIAERLRRAIADAPVHCGDLLIPITVSIGTATGLSTTITNGRLVEDLISRADDALYRAKRGGRNQVVAAPAPDTSDTSGEFAAGCAG